MKSYNRVFSCDVLHISFRYFNLGNKWSGALSWDGLIVIPSFHFMTIQKDVNQDLGWLKNIREAQGNVEVHALKQVAAINTRGIYIVGRPGPTSSMVSFAASEPILAFSTLIK